MDRLLKLVAGCGLLLWVAAGSASAQSTVAVTLVHHFGGFTGTGNGPLAPLVQAPDGSFYGTTIGSNGTIFRLVPASDPTLPGTVTTVHTFTATGATGAIPMAGLIRAADGSYYGTTSRGGANGAGTVYRMVVSPNGSGGLLHTVEVVHTFAHSDGWDSNAALFQDSDGSFYGTTTQGGTYDFGTVFRLEVTVNPVSGAATSTHTILHEFDGSGGKFPHGALIKAANGLFYGTTAEGGVGAGTIYQMATDISGGGDVFGYVSTIRDLDFSAGAYPHAALLEGNDGALYGTASRGGLNNAGSIFRLVPGSDPVTGAPTATLTVLHQFDAVSGAQPESALVRGQNGALYGTTKGDGGTGVSTVFRMTTSTNAVTGDVSGLLTVLHTFDDAGAPALGTDVHAGVVQAADGSFYGTAASGGANGDGTIIRFADKLIPTLTWAAPNPIRYGTMLSGAELNATASYGGLPVEGTFDYSPPAGTGLNVGTHTLSVVFTPADTATYASVAASVAIQVDQAEPFLSWGTPAPILLGTPLSEIQLSAIAFAGTQVAGTYAYSPSLGDILPLGKHDITVVFTPADTLNYTSATKTVSIVVYQAAPSTGPVKVLHSFERLASANTSVGTGPYSALFQGADGSFYGTTPFGGGLGITGGPEGQGRVFRFDPAGTFTSLYSFASPGPAFPYAGLVQGGDGMLYGAAYGGGVNIQGALYRVDTSTTPASVTTLHDFTGADGGAPYLSVPTFGTDGNLYGAAFLGGTSGVGAFYQLDLGGVVPVFHVLHDLTAAEGINPWPSLLLADDGKFYSPVTGGNAEDNGAILRIDSLGNLETVHAFRWNNGYYNGRFATGKLIQGQDGYLYGTTVSGGGTGSGIFTCQGFGCGTVYRLDIHTTPPTLTTLHTFTGTDGGSPISGLLQASDGFLYGTTSEGGDLGIGTLFRLDPRALTTTDPVTGWVTGAVERLHTFDGANGATPWAALTQGSDGAIYGATTAGGDLSGGTIFKFKVPTLTWAAPAAIDEGTPLGAQLNATASFAGSPVPGTFVYSPPAGTVLAAGTHRLSVTFTPTDTSTYFPARASVMITVQVPGALTVTIDQAAGQADPTNGSPIQFAVVFSRAVADFDAGDVSFAGSTAGGSLLASVLGSGASYVVSVTGMGGTGTVIASIGAGAATDPAGNPSSASTSTDNSVGFDGIAPTVTINQASSQPDPTRLSPIVFTVTFSEPVSGFDAGDVSLAGSTVGGTMAVNVTGSGASYTVSVTGMSGAGTVTASLVPGAAQDLAGNPSAPSTSTDNMVSFDAIAPTVTINQAAGQADPTAASPIQFTVLFSEPVSGFNAADISLAGSTVGGALVANVTGSGATYTLAVTGMSGTGTLRASVVAGAAQDAAGNSSAASTSTDNTVAFDNARPTVTINQAAGQADPAATLPVNFSVVFSEPVTGFTASDISFAGSTGSGTLTASVTGSGALYTVAVSGLTGPGTIVASVPAGVATDAVGNLNLASTSTDNSVSVTLTIARPDLVTIHGFLPTSVPVGGAVTVAEVTFNAGAAAAGASTTRYYLSPDAVWSTSDRLLASRSVGPLASGSFSLAPILNVVIPAGTVPGGYYLLAVADANRIVVESNEANNVSARPLTVQ